MQGQILKVIGKHMEVTQTGHLNIPLNELEGFVPPSGGKLYFEFSKDHSIIYFPMGFTKKELFRYNRKTTRSERKLVRCTLRKDVVRIYFNTSKRLINYFSQKADVYLVKRSEDVEEKEQIAVEFSNIAQIIQNEANTRISPSKYLYLGKYLPPLYEEQVMEKFDKFVIIKLSSLDAFHSPAYQGQVDLFITFNPFFINNVSRTSFTNRIRFIESSNFEERRFHLGTKPLADFMQKRGDTEIKVIFLPEGIILSKDREMKLPDNFRPIHSEFIKSTKKGYAEFSKEYEDIYHKPVPFTRNETYALNDLLLEVKLTTPIHYTYQFTKRVYWYFVVLWDHFEQFESMDPKYDKKQSEEIVLRILAIFNAFNNFFPDHKLITDNYFYRYFRKTVIDSKSILDYVGDIERLYGFYDVRKGISQELINAFESEERSDEILAHLKEALGSGAMSEEDKTEVVKLFFKNFSKKT